MHDGIIYTGVPNKEELKNAPGIPAADRIKPGGTAFIECLQTIACNPCEANCPTGAISIGAQISNRPVLDTNKCVGCGKCARLCPLNDISIVDGLPVWGKNCTHCMACICHCPTGAIEYGRKSLGKPRYHCDL